ncbi:MAG: ABC transporter permease, partial [Steroidobacteraceae bacterium]|nr:ABC transporter permease [Steroidobacteraceae bacterium]MDW8258170.1 ABC transporter permease [Gammaproteobacteria bacterium]
MIPLTETARLGLQALARNKMRAGLTTLGIVIGVAAVICMVAIGEGAQSRVRAQIEGAGTNVLMVFSGSSVGGGMRGGMGSQPTLTWDDLRAIQTELSAVRAASPQARATTQLISDTTTWTSTVFGVTPEFFLIRNWPIVRGSGLTASDQAGAAKNVVIGQTVAEKLFGSGSDPVGQTIRIRNAPYTVVGLLDRKGQAGMGQDQDDAVFVPMSTFQTRIQGGLSKFIPGMIYVSAVSSDRIDEAKRQIETLLRNKHRLEIDQEDDFSVITMSEMTGTLTATMNTFTTLLASIALVSLIVGGIGVMNIMLVSVTERTREIGIRMAVGAQPSDVLAQFLVEALILAVIGGAIGVLLGIGAAKFLANSFGWTTSIRSDIVLLALAVSGLVGIV